MIQQNYWFFVPDATILAAMQIWMQTGSEKEIGSDFSLPYRHSSPLPVAVRTQENRLSWILAPEYSSVSAEAGSSFFVIPETELFSAETWRYLLRLAPVHRAVLASWNAAHGKIPAGALLEALGSTVNYKNLNDWELWKKLSKNAADLAVLTDLPLTTLLVWESLDGQLKDLLGPEFFGSAFKRNFIKEIIEFCGAAETSAAAGIILRWKTGEKKVPADLRNQLYQAAFPNICRFRDRSSTLIRSMRLPPEIRISVPDDFEGGSITLTVSIKDASQLQKVSEFISSPELKEKTVQLLDLTS